VLIKRKGTLNTLCVRLFQWSLLFNKHKCLYVFFSGHFCLIKTNVRMSVQCPLLFNKHKCPYVCLSGHFCLISTSVCMSVSGSVCLSQWSLLLNKHKRVYVSSGSTFV